MAIAKAGTDTSTTANAASYSWSHTLVAGDNRMVAVCVAAEVQGGDLLYTVTNVTYGGVNMMLAASAHTTEVSGANNVSELWYILEESLPADGLNTIQVTGTWGAGVTNTFNFGSSCQYTGVSQDVPDSIDATFENSPVADDTIENTISPSENAWVISSYECGNQGTSWTTGEGQVELYDLAGGTTCRHGVSELRGTNGETSVSSTFNSGANRLSRVAVSFLEVATKYQMMI